MSNDRDKIIAKIKKCLALGKSSNEHEAAAALRQAQKLMQAHGVTDFDIETADIAEAEVRASAKSTPTKWEVSLANKIAGAFGCEVIFARNYYSGSSWKFIGIGPAAEIASYAQQVLMRQVKKARQTYIKTTLRRCGPPAKTRRADLYCAGWVSATTELLAKFVGSEAQQARLSLYVENKYCCHASTPRDRSAGHALRELDFGDLIAGSVAGKDAQLNRGVSAAAAPLALEATS